MRNSDSESGNALTVAVGSESTEVFVYDNGPRDGLAVLVLHGWGSSAGLMAPLTSLLSAKWRTISIDLPGHGNSPPPPSGWGVSEHITLVHAIVQLLEIERFAIVGHSNGGRIALEWASNPRLWTAPAFLVLNSPSGIRRKRSAAYYVRFWTARLLKFPFTILPSSFKERGLDWLRHSFVWSLLGSSDYRSLTGVMQETFVRTVNHYVSERLAAIECPVVIFWGTNDDAISRQQMDELVAGIPDAGLFELEGSGHYGYLDQPNTLASAVHELAKAQEKRRD